MFPLHLNNAFTLSCETYNLCFCENSNAGKAKLKKFNLTLILLIETCNFLTMKSRYGKFNQESIYRSNQSRPSFVKDMAQTFWCVFRFAVLTAVHLQNVNVNFHNVGTVG